MISKAPALLLAALLLAGCGAAQANVSAPPAPASKAPVPPGARTLAELGYANGPANLLSLPAAVRIVTRVDQPNVLTVLGDPLDAESVATHLRANLEGEGWTVTADGGDGILFSRPGWQGAFTVAPKLWGLTLRAKP